MHLSFHHHYCLSVSDLVKIRNKNIFTVLLLWEIRPSIVCPSVHPSISTLTAAEWTLAPAADVNWRSFVCVDWRKPTVLVFQGDAAEEDVIIRPYSERCSSVNMELWLTVVYGYKAPLLVRLKVLIKYLMLRCSLGQVAIFKNYYYYYY